MRVGLTLLIGVLAGFLMLAVAGGLMVCAGAFDMAATVAAGSLEQRVAGMTLEASVRKRSPRKKSPFASSPAVLSEGREHYSEDCLVCHGAPGLESSDIAKGMNPAPPDLSLPRTQKRSDGNLFWIIGQGIRMTGMPAFAPTHTEDEIWKMVAFVRHLPNLTQEERSRLTVKEKSEEQDQDR